MKIHERVKRGKKVWTVDGKINGIRHSFCSYSLRKHEDIGKVAAQAGHTERISLKHYLSMVSKDEAEAFWKIFPEEKLKAAA